MPNKILVLLFFAASLLSAQDFSGIRIYINPGHGGHDSDDRYIAATGFWESEGNLGKGLHLRNILNSFGATTKISRTTNNTSDDLALSTIVADANNFDADYFQSIHSNGFNGQTNYTLVLYEGSDNAPAYPEAKIIGGYIADEIFKAHRTQTKYNRGEVSFYGGPYLGLFSGNLTMPGTLSEGSFHDYIPESWRLRNNAYLKHEAWAITKALIKYFELTPLPYGEIAGILRDPFMSVNYYAFPFSNDTKKPLNLVKAVLLPGNKLYLGDALNNGFFMFDKVTPGEYQVILEAKDTGKDTVSVTVSAGTTSFVDRFLFAPNQRRKLSLTSNYPRNNSENISSTVKIKIHFDGPINSSTLGGRVFFQDEFGNNVQLKSLDEIDYENGWIIFEPDSPLENNANYTVKVLKGIEDMDGLKLDSDVVINFKVEPEIFIEGTTINDFEDITGWWQPGQDGSTTGIDADKTSFEILSNKAIDSTHSGKLTYVFNTDSNGICRIYYETEPEIPSTVNNIFGMWVFGDFSHNYLEYWFRNNDGTNIPISIDTLNWTGWKFKEVDLSEHSVLSFHSIVIKQNSSGEKKGQLYFDAMQSNLLVTDINNKEETLPTDFRLEQNYPNPFNPSTKIKYLIKNNGLVTLQLFDVLGRKVKELVNETKPAGEYVITFNAGDLPSGIYFYKLTSGNFSSVKKMMLAK